MPRSSSLALALALLFAAPLCAQSGVLRIRADHQTAPVSRGLYGVFFEEISHAGEGGLYGELVQNRGFEDANLPPSCKLIQAPDGSGPAIAPPRTPHFWTPGKPSDWWMPWQVDGKWPAWSLALSAGAQTESRFHADLVDEHPLSAASPHSLRLDLSLAAGDRLQLANSGFWGMGLKAGEPYDLSFYLRASTASQPVLAQLVDEDGSVLAAHSFDDALSTDWRKLAAVLTPTRAAAHARLILSFAGKGSVWVDFVSLFPENTFHHRPNGMRADLAQMVADLHPAFVRWPGGCFVEGVTIESRPQWKKTLGRLEDRPGTYSPWAYWSSDGFGYHEYLQFVEDMHSSALIVLNAGISCAMRSGTYIPDDELEPLIQDSLDQIEYAIGPVTSKYGAMRAAAGHPEPFPLKYVEIGNEDQGPRYGERYARFYKVLKQRYPRLQFLLSSWITGIDRAAIRAAGKVDIVDEHEYKPLGWPIENFHYFDNYKRGEWDLYMGEFATNTGVGSGNMLAAVNDAAFAMAMERNGDLVKMASYAPLLENSNKPDWEVNLIHFDSSRVFGRASYHVLKQFSENMPDYNLATEVDYRPAAAAPIRGPLLLGTFESAAEFKDLTVEQQGKVVYRADFDHDNYQTTDGKWSIVDGAYRQSTPAVAWAKLADRDFSDATLRLKARKISGSEGFILAFGAIDGRRLQCNFGGWGNHQHAIQAADSVVGEVARGEVTIDVWHDIQIDIHDRAIECRLDGKLTNQHTLARLDTVLAVAGRDEAKRQIILKAVNSGPLPAQMQLIVDGVKLAPRAVWTLISSPNPTDENTFAEPNKITPQQRVISDADHQPTLSLTPYSVNIIRLQEQ